MKMEEADSVFKQWLAICLGTLWHKHEEARLVLPAVMVLKALLVDPAPVVRAASVYALGIFINSRSERTEHASFLLGV
jgi:regulator-associated protein of mTOR